MRHSEWLRLKADSAAVASLRASGDKIVMALRAKGYQCHKHTRRLSWNLRKGTISYSLAWLSAPMNEWSLLPHDATPERETLLSQIRSILKMYRGGGRFTQPCPEVESFTDSTSPTPPTSNQGDRCWRQDNYPWTIVRLLPNAQRYVVTRFYSRSEADNHKRFLSRFMPAAEFEVVFDAPSVSDVDIDMQNKVRVD